MPLQKKIGLKHATSVTGAAKDHSQTFRVTNEDRTEASVPVPIGHSIMPLRSVASGAVVAGVSSLRMAKFETLVIGIVRVH